MFLCRGVAVVQGHDQFFFVLAHTIEYSSLQEVQHASGTKGRLHGSLAKGNFANETLHSVEKMRERERGTGASCVIRSKGATDVAIFQCYWKGWPLTVAGGPVAVAQPSDRHRSTRGPILWQGG